jgi:hypothetical protein
MTTAHKKGIPYDADRDQLHKAVHYASQQTPDDFRVARRALKQSKKSLSVADMTAHILTSVEK